MYRYYDLYTALHGSAHLPRLRTVPKRTNQNRELSELVMEPIELVITTTIIMQPRTERMRTEPKHRTESIGTDSRESRVPANTPNGSE